MEDVQICIANAELNGKAVGHLKCFRFRIGGYFDALPNDLPVGSHLRPSVLLIAPGRDSVWPRLILPMSTDAI